MINASGAQVRGLTMCLSKAGVKIGNSDTKDVDIVGGGAETGVHFAINGLLYYKADAADIAITAAAVQATLTSCIYLICLNASGTLSTVKGTEVLTADITAQKKVLTFPQPVVNTCVIGYVRVDVATGYTFTAGTTDFDASGITDTFVDLATLPVTPLTS